MLQLADRALSYFTGVLTSAHHLRLLGLVYEYYLVSLSTNGAYHTGSMECMAEAVHKSYGMRRWGVEQSSWSVWNPVPRHEERGTTTGLRHSDTGLIRIGARVHFLWFWHARSFVISRGRTKRGTYLRESNSEAMISIKKTGWMHVTQLVVAVWGWHTLDGVSREYSIVTRIMDISRRACF